MVSLVRTIMHLTQMHRFLCNRGDRAAGFSGGLDLADHLEIAYYPKMIGRHHNVNRGVRYPDDTPRRLRYDC